jgi:MFS family permease
LAPAAKGSDIDSREYSVSDLPHDARLLFASRFLRLFAYGGLSMVLVLYLTSLGFSEASTGLLLTLTLAGDTLVSLYLTTHADRVGRRATLVVGAALMAGAGFAFASTPVWWLLLLVATIGVISPSGHEVGPFLPIEQAALAQLIPASARTQVFAWYTLVGSLATAVGSLAGGLLVSALQSAQFSASDAYRSVVVLYGACGGLLVLLFIRLSPDLEVAPCTSGPDPNRDRPRAGLTRSRRTVAKLSALFALDAFGGGFVVQSLAAYWFHLRFGLEPRTLGVVFLSANLLAAFSALVAGRLASRIGLVNTMVATHLPSNVLLILVPFMPTATSAVTVLLIRFSISQMDVPARQSYVMAVVAPEERSAAAGITGIARTLGAAVSPSLAGLLLARPEWIGMPFIIAGSVKMAYDVLLYLSCAAARPAEQRDRHAAS